MSSICACWAALSRAAERTRSEDNRDRCTRPKAEPRVTARNRLAANGLRRHQRPRRSTQAMGRARIGSPASQRRSSAASSAASWLAPGR